MKMLDSWFQNGNIPTPGLSPAAVVIVADVQVDSIVVELTVKNPNTNYAVICEVNDCKYSTLVLPNNAKMYNYRSHKYCCLLKNAA